MKGLLIGGGIAGLTTALRFQQLGLDFELFERTPAFKPVGAGIVLAGNALGVYQRLGLLDAIADVGRPLESAAITDASLRPISVVKNGPAQNLAIHRAALHAVLLEHLQGRPIHLGKQFLTLEQNGEQCLCRFEDGTRATGDFVIGADGIHSNVRPFLEKDIRLRDAGQQCWRGVVDLELPGEFKALLTEAWGSGGRFGFMEIAAGQVYWYAVRDKTTGEIVDTADGLAAQFQGFHPLVGELIRAASPQTWHFAELGDLAPYPDNWHRGKVCLIGDAAHATTPNMGQGACQAIEDAYALGTALQQTPNLEAAFTYFHQLRAQKAWSIVKSSWQIGKIAHLKNPVGRALRNTAMRLTPAAVTRRSLRQVLDLSYLDK